MPAVRTMQLIVMSQTIDCSPPPVHFGTRNASGMRASETVV
jgi:hypothetical protein